MKLRLICVGKLAQAWQRDAAADYTSRLQRYCPVELVELKEEKGGRKGDNAAILRREADKIIQKIPERARLILLDEHGRQFASEQWAEELATEMLHGGRDWCLVIGGPYGLDDTLRKRADLTLSLSKMTFTHQMARIFLLEQLYRGMTIIRNEPYHNH